VCPAAEKAAYKGRQLVVLDAYAMKRPVLGLNRITALQEQNNSMASPRGTSGAELSILLVGITASTMDALDFLL